MKDQPKNEEPKKPAKSTAPNPDDYPDKASFEKAQAEWWKAVEDRMLDD